MVLLISENQSLYKSYTKMKRDSMITNNLNNGIYEINFSSLPKVRVFHQVYRDFKNDSIKVIDRIATKDFIFPAEKLNWILGKDRKKISDFDCQNAYCSIGNRKFEAWFTTSVLPNEGPYRFKGLPGLVLEVNDGRKFFEIKFLGIKNFKVPLDIPTQIVSTSREKYLKARRSFFNDPIGQSQIYMGRSSFISEENKKRIEGNIKSENVFIED